MKNKIIYLLIIIIAVGLTAALSINIYSEKIKNTESLNEETCINFLQSGTQMAMNSAAAYKRQKMDYTLENYIKTIENSFAQDIDFIELFKSDVKKLSEFRENNLNIIYSDNDGSMTPMLYNASAESFEQAEINMLHEVVTAYCSNHQDYQPCIDIVFSKILNLRKTTKSR